MGAAEAWVITWLAMAFGCIAAEQGLLAVTAVALSALAMADG